MYLVSLWGGIGSRNAKFNCIPFALRAERYRTRWTAFHSTRCAEKALHHFAHLRCQHFPTQLPSTALQRTPFHHPINFLNGTAWKGEGCIHLSSFIGHLSDVPIPTTHESLARYSYPAETKCATHLAGGKQEGEGTSEDAHRWGVLRGWSQVE